MEKTVTVSLKEFDELRKFKEDFENSLNDKNGVVVEYNFSHIKYFTESEAVIHITDERNELMRLLNKYKDEVEILTKENKALSRKSEAEIKRLKSFNIFEFLRWKKEK
jgi:hypothetical protein